MTDVEEVLSSLREIVYGYNKLDPAKISVEAINWIDFPYQESKTRMHEFDYIFASDIVWLEHLIEPFVVTLSLLSRSRTHIYIAHQTRSQKCDDVFFSLLKKHHFYYEKVVSAELNACYISDKIAVYAIKK